MSRNKLKIETFDPMIEGMKRSHAIDNKYAQKYTFNENFFDNPETWTEEQAYWLGWLISDGKNQRNQVSIVIQEKDKCVLENLKIIIQYTGPLNFVKRKPESIFGKEKQQYQHRYGLILSRKSFCQKLTNMGIKNTKGSHYEFPIYLQEYLYPHFLRGLFEGDGTFCFSSTNNFHINLVSTDNMLDKIINIFHKIGLNSAKTGKRFNNNAITLRMCGNFQAMKLFNYIYPKCKYYLPRKLIGFFKLFFYKRDKKKQKKHEKVFLDFSKNIIPFIEKHPELIA